MKKAKKDARQLKSWNRKKNKWLNMSKSERDLGVRGSIFNNNFINTRVHLYQFRNRI